MMFIKNTFKLSLMPILSFLVLSCSSAKHQESSEQNLIDTAKPKFTYDVENGKSFLWEVTSDNSKVYLLGSIHLGKESMYPLDSVIENAFEESGDFVVEIDMRPDLMGEFLKSANYSDKNQSLEKVLRKSLYDSLFNKLSQYGMPKQFINRMKPWFAGTMLMMNKITESGYDPNQGIDKYFLDRARNSKSIHQLESIEMQTAMLDSASSDANLFIEYTLRDIDQLTSMTDSTFYFWENGDINAMEKMIIEPYASDTRYQDIMKMMFDNRNFNMTSKIEDFLNKKGKVFFVVVGSGHLLGENGIPEILKRKNSYNIKRY